MQGALDPALEKRRTAVIATLQEAGLVLDDLWKVTSVRADTGLAALQIGEANQAVHRALIALSPGQPAAPESFTVEWA